MTLIEEVSGGEAEAADMHTNLITEMKRNDKLPIEDRVRLARQNRKSQLENFEAWDAQDEAGRRADDVSGFKLTFPDDVYLMDAAAKGAVQDMEDLLNRGLDPNTSNHEGLTALHQCCIDGQEKMAKLLVQHGASVKVVDRDGWTPLHAAATCGHLNIVKMLVKEGADLLAVNGDGDMPFDITEDEETLHFVEEAMTRMGITHDMVSKKREELHERMQQDIQTLISQGEDLNIAVNEDGATLLHVAIVNEYNDLVKVLLDNGASDECQDIEGWRPIHAAAFWGNKAAVDLLVAERQTNLRAMTDLGLQPYDMCDDAKVRSRILELINDNPEKYALPLPANKKGSTSSGSSGDNIEESSGGFRSLQIVAGTTTNRNTTSDSEGNVSNRNTSEKEVKRRDSDTILDEVDGGGEPSGLPGLSRVESVGSRRNSVREAKKQAPIIRIGHMNRKDSVDSYDDSYDLMLLSKKTRSAATTITNNASTAAVTERMETVTETQPRTRKESSSSSSSSDNDENLLVARNEPEDTNVYQDVYEAPTGVNVYEAPTGADVYEAPTGADMYETPTGADEYEAPTGADVYEAPTGADMYETPTGADVYEAPTGADVYEAPTSEVNEVPTSTNVYEAPTSGMNEAAPASPKTAPRTIFSDISYIQPNKKAVKKPAPEAQSEPPMVRVAAQPKPKANTKKKPNDPPPPYQPRAIEEQRESLSSLSSIDSDFGQPPAELLESITSDRSRSSTVTPRTAGTAEPRSSSHDSPPVVTRRKKFDALVDRIRTPASTEGSPKRGTLQELKLRRQKSRSLQFEDQEDSLTAARIDGFAVTANLNRPATTSGYRPPDSPTRIRHVFKDPGNVFEPSIFKRTRRCSIM